MRLGNAGGKNKGKKYLKITGNEEITPENQAKANDFKEWFSQNYGRIQVELIAKRTCDEDVLNETFLRIYDKIRFGGLEIADYKAYFHRAFFTNYVQESMKKNDVERMFVPDDHAVDMFDETMDALDELQQKMQLCKDVLSYIRERFGQSDYDLFVAYIKLGRRKYDLICNQTQLPYAEVSGIIGRIKRNIRSNNRFVRVRKSM